MRSSSCYYHYFQLLIPAFHLMEHKADPKPLNIKHGSSLVPTATENYVYAAVILLFDIRGAHSALSALS